ncbi:zincin [Linderina pennispora]|uniref:Zincin n=1 Tax=Linderina pennispora TaxID=61395 RepID=A0A1Y1W3Q6_9FUNG|nr:zincin [Linderina pennispora]ORX68022.1 zincin [Linderina pennispora]
MQCSGYRDWDIGVHFVDNARIQELNRTYRGKDRATDILSAEVDLPRTGKEDDMNLGDMFLAMPYILKDCRQHNDALGERLPILFTHGICHLLGCLSASDEILQKYHRLK